jgi:hypothetical protein
MNKPTICCPTCGSENIRSFDNEPLSHPTKQEVETGTPRYDNEIYIKFICDDCPAETRIFTEVFTLNLK